MTLRSEICVYVVFFHFSTLFWVLGFLGVIIVKNGRNYDYGVKNTMLAIIPISGQKNPIMAILTFFMAIIVIRTRNCGLGRNSENSVIFHYNCPKSHFFAQSAIVY